MRALYLPGPSYNPKTAETAGWVKILELYHETLQELGYDVIVGGATADLDESSPMARYMSYGLPYLELATEVDLIFGAPIYSVLPLLRAPDSVTKLVYVWNNANWWRAEQLAPEYAKYDQKFEEPVSAIALNTVAFKLADKVIACSPFVKKTHAKLVPENKIAITFWGVDSEQFTPGTERRYSAPMLRVLFLGADPIRKGLKYLLDAAAPLHNVEVVIAGAQVDLDPHPHIRNLGMIPHKDVAKLMQFCHVICIPTLEDGIALAIQEGMACGLVPISTPDASEVFGLAEGYKVQFRNSTQITSALRELTENRELLKTKSVAARNLAVKQSWSETKNALKTIIQLAVSDKKNGVLDRPVFESKMPWL